MMLGEIYFDPMIPIKPFDKLKCLYSDITVQDDMPHNGPALLLLIVAFAYDKYHMQPDNVVQNYILAAD